MKKQFKTGFNKCFLVLLFLSFSISSTYGQVVVIGTQNNVNSNTSYPAPYGNWYWGAKHQFLVLASELSANCALPGDITSLAFNVSQVQGTALDGFTIKIKSTAATSLTGNFDLTGFTTVFGPQTFTETTGWNTHIFTTPFNWDGSSNILIEVCFNNTFYTYNALTFYSTTSFNSSIYYRADASGVCGQATGTPLTIRPNMRLEMQTSVIPIMQPTKNYIDYGSIEQGFTKKDSLYIKNIGCGVLNISNITKQTPYFTLSTTSGTVNPFDSMKLVLTFVPPFLGAYVDTVKIFSNAGDSIVPLTGICVPPPQISVVPDSFNVVINSCSDTVTQSLTINNTGAGDLNYDISVINPVLYDGFESGNIASWNIGTGIYLRDVITTNPADGLYSFRLTGGNTQYYDGINHTFPDQQVNYISYKVMSPVGSTGWNCAVSVGNSADIGPNGAIGDFWIDNGSGVVYLWCNSGTYTYPLVQGQWYKIEFKNINYTTKTFDYYVDDNLIGTSLIFWNTLINNVNVIHLFSWDAGSVSNYDEIIITGTDTPWMILSSTTGTVPPSGSTVIDVDFISTGLISDTYTSNLYISSNDPTNPLIAIPCTLTVNGSPDIDIPVSPCPAFDTLMIGDAQQIDITIYNSGCDTLLISNINSSLNQFFIDSFPPMIPPYSNDTLYISFVPSVVGTHFTDITVQNNDNDTTFCMQGVAIPAPTINIDPLFYNVSVSCGDSLTDTLFITNTGGAALNWTIASGFFLVDDFDPVIDIPVWAVNNGIASNNCGAVSGNALYFNDAAVRQAQTIDLNTIGGGTINFYIRLGNGGACEYLDGGEDIVLEYSNNGGGAWSNISTYYSGNYFTFTPFSVPIPLAAQTPATRFRWRQLAHSGSGYDNWALDNVVIGALLFTTVTPSSGSTPTAGTDTVFVEFNSSGFYAGTYYSFITISSNDPVNSILTIPCTMNVVGYPDMQATLADVIAPSCLDLDSIMEFTTSIDSVLVANLGCDTLKIDSLLISSPLFTLFSAPNYILPGASGNILIRFSPLVPGNLTASLSVYTNDIDTAICLNGRAFPRAIVSFNSDTFIVTLPCQGSATDTLIFYNTGLSNLNYSALPDDNYNSAFFDGINDYMTTLLNIDQSGTSPGLTMEAWVYPLSTSAGNHVVISTDNGGFDWSVLRNGGNWFVYSGAASVNTGFSVDINKWQHIAAVFIPGTGIRFYKNGQLFTSASIGLDAADNNINLGRRSAGVEYFGGRIDEARIWNTQRTQPEIISTMYKSINGNETGLLAYWNFNNGLPNDITGNGWNGNLINGATTGTPNAPVTPAWLSYLPLPADTIITNDSTIVEFNVSSSGLIIGQYTSQMLVNSNDPLTSPDTVIFIMNIIGAPDFQAVSFEDTIAPLCLYLDSIIEFTTSEKTITLTNNGCDTLWIDSMLFSLPEVTLFSAVPYILPGDTSSVVVQFSPVAPGTYTGISTIYTNDIDTTICFQGYSFPMPVLNYTPDTIDITINACQDTLTSTILISNSGLSDLHWSFLTPMYYSDDFDPAINAPMWLVNNGFLSTNCGAISGNALYFNDVVVRQAQTIDINTTSGGSIDFYIRLGDGGLCEYLDGGEDVVLEYSNNGGGAWTNISTFYSGNYFTFTPFSFTIPAGAQTPATRFRWRQLSHSGAGYDNWALDDIVISTYGQSNLNIIPVPVSGTTVPDDTTIVTIFLTDSALSAGTTQFTVLLNSDDPFKAQNNIIVNITVDPLPPIAPVAADTSICFGNPTPDLVAMPWNPLDTVLWYDEFHSFLFEGDTLVTGETVSGTYIYLVSSIDYATGCESQADTVLLVINNAPSEPVSNDESGCFGTPLPPLVSTGTIPLWYTDGTLTNLVYTGTSYNTGITAPGSYTFYVADSTAGCPKSSADTVALQIFALPNTPVADDVSVCEAGPIPPLTATVSGTDSIRWYNASMVYVGYGSVYNTGMTLPGTYKYYVSSVDTVTLCESLADSAFLVISSTPQPVAGNVSSCEGMPTPPLDATGTNIEWYDSGMNPVFSGSTYYTGLTAPGTYVFYVTQTISGCESDSLEVTLTINSVPSAPVGTGSSICYGLPVPPLTSTGSNVIWYEDPALTIIAATGNSFNTGITAPGNYVYYVTQTVTGCTSASDTVYLNIFSLPVTPSASDVTICFGTPTPDLVAGNITGNDTVHWYDNPSLLISVYTGNPFATSQTAVGAYVYYVTQTDTVSGCRSNADTVTLTINDVPAQPVASDVTICSEGSPGLLSSSGTNPQWYDNPSLTTVIYSGSNFNTGITTTGSYTYYVTDSVLGCPQGPADTVILIVNQTPAAPGALPLSAQICFNDANPTFSATGTNVEWWNDPALTNLEYSGNNFVPAVTAPGAYSYYVTETVNNCTGPADTVNFQIYALPVVTLGTDVVQCGGSVILDAGNPGAVYSWSTTETTQSITVSSSGIYDVIVTNINGCVNYDTIDITILPVPVAPVSIPQYDSICVGDPNPSFSASGTNIEWWGDTSFINLLLAGDPYTPIITTPGTYYYYVTQTVGGCISLWDTVQFTINITLPPVAGDVSVVSGSPVPDLAATGNNIQWYDDTMTPVFTGNNYPTGQTAIGEYTYYVTQTENGCESTPVTVTLTIYPGAPVANDEAVCEGQPVPDLFAAGANVQWFSDPGLTVLEATGNTFTTGITLPGTYTYYVTQTVNSVQSPADTVLLVIYALPAQPAATSQSVCEGGVIPPLTATGTNIQWYDSLMVPVYPGSVFNTGHTMPGIYVYFVTQSANGCEGPALADTLTIYQLPLPPFAGNDTAICYGDPVPDLSATGNNIIWYDSGGSVAGSGNVLTTGQTLPGIYLYFATQTDLVTLCESYGDTVILSINSTLPPDAQDEFICFGNPVPPLTATGTNIQWYDSLMTPVYNGNTFNTGQTAVGIYVYYAEQTDPASGCTSPLDTVYLVISSPPDTPPVISDEMICFGTAVPPLTATTGTIINWYSDAGLTNQVYTGNPFNTGMTQPGTYIYYATDSTIGCPEGPPAQVSLIIYPLPATLSVDDVDICYGTPAPDLIAIGDNIQWYDISMNLLFAGDTFSTGQTMPGSYTYLVTQSDILTYCASSPDTVVLTINPLPAAPTVTDTTVCAGTVIPPLVSTGTNINWYDTTGALVYSGIIFPTGNTIPGTYIYYADETSPFTGCISPQDTAVLIIQVSPPVPVADDVSVCEGNPVPWLTSTGTNVSWYSNPALTFLVNTGNTFNTGQTVVGSYTYYVTDSMSGCVSSAPDTVTLFINSAPAQPVANDVTICFGTPAILSSTGNNPQWFADVTLLNMIGSGTSLNLGSKPAGLYIYYVADYEAGCGKSIPDTVLLTVNPAPLVTANTFYEEIAQGQSITLTAYNALYYSWSPPTGLNTTTGPTVIASPGVTTIYTVTGTNSYGCSSDTNITIMVSVGIEETDAFITDLKIYPNPAGEYFITEFVTNTVSDIDLYIYNILGEKVTVMENLCKDSPAIRKQKVEINTGNLADGMYSLEFVTSTGKISRRIIIQRNNY